MSLCLLAFVHWPFPPIQEPESQSQVSETVILAPAEELQAPRAVAVTVTGEELAATGERSLPRALGEAPASGSRRRTSAAAPWCSTACSATAC